MKKQHLWPERGTMDSATTILIVSRDVVIAHYEALHQAGVIHTDIELRHILRGPPVKSGKPEFRWRLIDFEAAIAPPPEEAEALGRGEIKRIRNLFAGRGRPGIVPYHRLEAVWDSE